MSSTLGAISTASEKGKYVSSTEGNTRGLDRLAIGEGGKR